MRTLAPFLSLTLLLTACPPPEVVEGGGVTVELLYPEPDQQIMANEDGSVDILGVISVGGLALTDPSSASGVVDGEGHWHLNVGADKYVASFGSSATLRIAEGDALAPTKEAIGVLVRVDLHDNDHGLLVVDGEPAPSAQTEVLLVPYVAPEPSE